MKKRFILSFIALLPTIGTSVAIEAERSAIDQFETKYGFKNVFWCAENADFLSNTLNDSRLSGAMVPGIAFEASLYCQERHFPASTEMDCQQSLDALMKLDKIFEGFGKGEFAQNVMNLCKTFKLL